MDKSARFKEDFAALLDRTMPRIDRLKVGERIETSIVSISGDTVFLDLSGKSEGLLNRDELIEKDGSLSHKEGDKIEVYYIGLQNGEMRFTTRIDGESADPRLLEEAYRNGIPVSGTVLKEIRGGYEVIVGNFRAFCPYSQMDIKRNDNSAEYIGKVFSFKISEFAQGGRRLVLSRRLLLEEEYKETVEKLKEQLKVGMRVSGVVTSLQDFGAFVDIEGFQALLPISELALERVEDISSILKEGEEIEAEIIKIDWEQERISLSLKALQKNPWESAETKYKIGSTHKGTVLRTTSYGAFIQLEPGLDGLLHISEMHLEEGVRDPLQAIKKGDSISVRIKAVDSNEEKISLSESKNKKMDKSQEKYLKDGKEDDKYSPFAELLG